VSTDNVGLVELKDGVSLIRLGKPLWPEFAAWRYSRRFSRRRWKSSLTAGTIIAGAVGVTLGLGAVGYWGAAYTMGYAGGLWLSDEGHKRRRATTVRLGERLYKLRQDEAEAVRLFADGRKSYGLAFHHSDGVHLLRGPDVRRVLGFVIPALTPFGGRQAQVSNAIKRIDTAGNAEYCIDETLKEVEKNSGFFTQLPVETRLALEMALQEDGERRAFEGELAALERAWREAEEIATIADSLMVPGDVLERIAGLRKGIRSPGFAFN
jgi:hypothetical protein